MASSSVFFFLCIALSLGAGALANGYGYPGYHGAALPYHLDKAAAKQPVVDTTVIQGYVYCQNCKGQWTKSLAGAKVVAECKNGGGRGAVKGSDMTDHVGFYQIKLAYGYKNAAQNCKATVVSSSDRTCRVATNVGNGKWGAEVKFLKTFYNEAFFKSGPFAFSEHCPTAHNY